MALEERGVSRAEAELMDAWRAGWRRDPELTIDEWADRHRVLSGDTSAEPGQWRTSRTPYLREVLRELSPSSPTRRVVLMWGAQTGKSEGGFNWIGYVIHHTPGPMMMIQPTVEVAHFVSKERIVPLVQNTPALAERVLENRSRDGNNTILNKRFHGGFLKISGANSAASLRSTPIKFLFCDEIDAYPADVDGEGDPLDLAEARSTTFSRGKTLITSTPTIKDFSRIEKEFARGDQRRYFVPCPHCGHSDWIRWANIDYRNDDPATACLLCSSCGVLIEERYKTQMLERGEWRPTAAGDGETISFHLSGLYSPLGWLSWEKVVREWLEAKKDPSKLKVFLNTRLAETWEERAESIEPDAIFARRESYAAEVPDGVGILVAAVDVQADRLEYQVKGYGAGEESWLISWGQVIMEPAAPAKAWLELDQLLQQDWEHAGGRKVRIECVAVDSGFKADDVYRFCKARASRRVFAVKGSPETGKPLVGRPTSNNAFRARLYLLCTDTGKETVHARLRIASPGAGYMHLPAEIDREYVDQLTAEKVIRKFVKGRAPQRQWVKTRERNEALDLEVYSLAALRIVLGPQPGRALLQRAAKLSVRTGRQLPAGEAVAPPASPAPAPKPPVPPAVGRRTLPSRPRRGWVQGWRR
jgi:phage terminase large subunit GpA-like protein